eukprot:Sdes_comp17440_c0_seq1m6665
MTVLNAFKKRKRSQNVIFVVLFAWCTLCSSFSLHSEFLLHGPAIPQPGRPFVHIGGLFESVNNSKTLEIAQKTVDAVNNSSDFSFTLRLISTSTNGSPLICVSQALRMLLGRAFNLTVFGFIGPETSAEMSALAPVLSVFKVFSVSCGSSLDSSSATKYPYLMRTVPSNLLILTGMVEVLHLFRWSNVAFLYSDDDLGRSFYDTMPKVAAGLNSTASYRWVSFGAGANFSQPVLEDTLRELESSGLRIFVLICSTQTGRQVLAQVKALQMYGPDFQWILFYTMLANDFLALPSGDFNFELYEVIRGALGVRPFDPNQMSTADSSLFPPFTNTTSA